MNLPFPIALPSALPFLSESNPSAAERIGRALTSCGLVETSWKLVILLKTYKKLIQLEQSTTKSTCSTYGLSCFPPSFAPHPSSFSSLLPDPSFEYLLQNFYLGRERISAGDTRDTFAIPLATIHEPDCHGICVCCSACNIRIINEHHHD